MATPFVHLHVHTEYSLLDGLSQIKPLVARAAALGLPALAITDHGAMYGAVEFYREAIAHGIKPILGVEAYVAPRGMADRDPKLDARAAHLVLVAATTEGYRNLVALTTTAHLNGYYYKPRIDHELLSRHARGLIGLSGCLKGEIPQAILRDDLDGARRLIATYRDILGPDNFYLELQNHGLADQARVADALVPLSREFSLPLAPTNDVHYIAQTDAEAQDALMCIQMGLQMGDTTTPRMGAIPEFYLKNPEEMAARFGSVPEALANTVAIADRCQVTLDLGNPTLPHFPVPEGETADSHLRALCEAGLRRHLATSSPAYRERLEYELGVIGKTGYASYFLIVQDFVTWARSRGILTSVRGSAGGSLVLYAAGVTDTDPLAYKLPFDRFLNPQRVSMPDIDVDFMDSRRDEVITYVMDKYGADHVAQIITFGRMGARAAIRDVGRVLGIPYAKVDHIAKLIPGATTTLADARATVGELQTIARATPEGTRLLTLAGELEGVARHASTHAAGLIISREPLAATVPLQKSTHGDLVMTQYDMGSVEALGLLKVDFLGLNNLTILDTTIRLVKATRNVAVDLAHLPFDDRRTYDLLSGGYTMGVFQLEGQGMTRYLVELQPNRIEDLMALVALFRPGPMANIPAYIRRKHGQEAITYLHPLLEPVLNETYGVLVYQEDVMLVAQAIAGYTLADADLLRYAIGKKIKDKLIAQREHFFAGARDRGVPSLIIEQLWELFEPFARYGFNRSHAAAYGTLAYATAYLKANYPIEYMTALLTHHAGDLDKTAAIIAECRRMQIPVLLPDINQSEASFTISPPGIRFGLAAIKNVGPRAVDPIVATRTDAGPFRDLADFCRRVRTPIVTQRTIASLIKAGAFDALGPSRSALLAQLENILTAVQRSTRKQVAAQETLFALESSDAALATDSADTELSPYELLALEKEMLGLYISGHPVRKWIPFLAPRITASLDHLSELADRSEVTVGGLVTGIRKKTTNSGQVMAFVTLEDLAGHVQVLVFPTLFTEAESRLRPDEPLLVKGMLDLKEGAATVLATQIIPIPSDLPQSAPATADSGPNDNTL